jgi:hypothetical protein
MMTDDGLRLQERLDHIARPGLPWRADGLTECGHPTAGMAVITVDEWKARIRRIGQQRAAFTVCMTCAGREGYSRPWRQDPIGVLFRELKRVGEFRPSRAVAPEHDRMVAELRAITDLVAAHRDEFDGYLSGLGDTVDLARARNRRKAR